MTDAFCAGAALTITILDAVEGELTVDDLFATGISLAAAIIRAVQFTKVHKSILTALDQCATIVVKNGAHADDLAALHSEISNLENTGHFRNGALDHIFCGDVKSNGSVSGYHYENVSGAKTRIIPGTKTSPNRYGVYEAKVIGKISNNGKSAFFPSTMSPQEVVDRINQAYLHRHFVGGNTYSGTTSTGMAIEMYLDTNYKIISAYPIY